MPAGSAVAMATTSAARWVRALSWACRLIAAAILLQTLFFKFTAAPESVYIFSKLGVFLNHYVPSLPVYEVQVFARIGSGIMELVAAVLLLVPRSVWAGAVLAMAATGGAIFSHLTFLGLVVMDDGGLLFALALVTFAASVVALFLDRTHIPVFGKRFK
jgi:putative oxidoreductase